MLLSKGDFLGSTIVDEAYVREYSPHALPQVAVVLTLPYSLEQVTLERIFVIGLMWDESLVL